MNDEVTFLIQLCLIIVIYSGYMAPEYIKHGQFSIKSDVFSFGVMILEIVCGQRNSQIRDSEENAQDLLSFVSVVYDTFSLLVN